MGIAWMTFLQTPGHEPLGLVFVHVVGQLILKVGVALGVAVRDPLGVGDAVGVVVPLMIGACGIVTVTGSPVSAGEGTNAGISSGTGFGNWTGCSSYVSPGVQKE